MESSEQRCGHAPWSVRLLTALVLVGPLVWLNGNYDFTDLPKGVAIQFGSLCLVAWWLGAAAWSGELNLRTSPVLLPLVGCLAWAGLTLGYAHNPMEGCWPLLCWLPALPVVVVGAAVLREPAWRRGVLQAVGGAGALTSLLGIVQALTGWSPVEQVMPPAASFANGNMAADFVVLTLSVNVGWALDEPRTGRRWLAVGAALACLFFLSMTCRMAWLSVAVQAILWGGYLGWRAWTQRRREISCRARWVVGLSALAAVALATVLSLPAGRLALGRHLPAAVEQKVLGRMQHIVGKGIASSGRIEMWLNTLALVEDHPWLGVGLGNHKVAYPPYRNNNEDLAHQLEYHVHNDFLQLTAETGLVGLLLLLWLFLAVAWAYRANFARISPGWPALTWAMVGAMAGGFLVSANVSFSLYRAASPLILAAFLAVVAASGPEATLRPWRGSRQRAWCAAGVVLVAMLLVIHLLWAWDFLRADRLHRRIAAADAKMRWDQVVRDGAQALGIKPNPRRLTTQLYVGRALVELRRPAEAIPLIEDVLAAYPHHLNAWYNLGLAYEGAGDDGNAIRAYREVLVLSPDLFQAHDRLGCIYLRRAEFAEAEAAFRAAAVNAPPRERALAWNNLGMVAIARKDYGTAERRFRKAVSLEPRGMLGHKNLGILYLQYLDFPQESMVHLRRALELDPDMPEAESIRAILREFGAHADTAAIRRLVLELEFKETGKDLWNRPAGAHGVK